MANPGVSLEDYQQAETALQDHGGNESAAARALNMNRVTFRNRIESGRRLHKEARGAFGGTAPDGFAVKGVSTLYGPDGEVKAEWVKTTADMVRQQEMVREALDEMARKLPRLPARPAKGKNYNDDHMAFIPWGDPHFGMLAWGQETGGADFDTDIAKRELCGAVDVLVSQSPSTRKLVIASLGDFYHADNYHGMTPNGGNVLDVDSRLPRVMSIGVAAVRQAIESGLRHHETVHFVPVKGNHDPVLSTALGIMLSHVYENEPRVTVDTSPAWRHYIRHGATMIGLAHGDKTKDRDLPGLMATERPEDWGQSRHRYYHRGHDHQDSITEFNGCLVEHHRTLAPGDAYAASHGWLSGRSMKQIIYHADHGEVARSTCSIDMLRAA